MSLNDFDWDQDGVIDALKALYKDGLSASQIAGELASNFNGAPSRNSIIGKIHRLGIHRDGSNRPVRIPRMAAPPKPRASKRAHISVSTQAINAKRDAALGFVEEAEIEIPLDDVRPESGGVTLLQLTDKACRWPYGEPSQPDFCFCGEPGADILENRPYCGKHAARARGSARQMTESELERRRRGYMRSRPTEGAH